MRSVRVRITLATTLVFAAALSLASVLLVEAVRASVKDRIRQDGVSAIDRVRAELARGRAPQQLEWPRAVEFYVLDTSGRVVAGSTDERLEVHLVEGRVVVAAKNQDPPIVVTRAVDTPSGAVTLVATSPLEEVRRSVDALSTMLWVGMPALVVLVGLVAWFMVGRALRPVDAIRAEVAAISGTTMHRRVPEPPTDDEVAQLARTMNAMLGRLEQASDRQRRFVSDASHELRSPIASIRTTVEVALRKGDTADWRDVAGNVLADDERLERVVDELLELARLDEDDQPLPEVPVDIDDIVLDEAARVRGVEVDTTRVSAGRVRGSRSQLDRVVRNLLENGARHATTRVAVALTTVGPEIELDIDDDGPGIAPDDRDRVFERFTRLEEGRSRDGGGVGLGLAMVKAIVERHGGRVSIDRSPLGGARFAVRLPAGETSLRDEP